LDRLGAIFVRLTLPPLASEMDTGSLLRWSVRDAADFTDPD
jgi:hypothetical protein